jgi:hypothetical protein
MMYKSINDVYPFGETKIWYQNRSFWEKKNPFRPEVKLSEIEETHTLLGFVDMTDLEEIFYKMQGEVWSPEGQARRLIETLGLVHTSMSIGDVVEIAGKFFVCDIEGFTEIK